MVAIIELLEDKKLKIPGVISTAPIDPNFKSRVIDLFLSRQKIF